MQGARTSALCQIVPDSARYDPIFRNRREQTSPILAEIRWDMNAGKCVGILCCEGSFWMTYNLSFWMNTSFWYDSQMAGKNRSDQTSGHHCFFVKRCIRLCDGFRFHFELELQRSSGKASENLAYGECSVAEFQFFRDFLQ